MRFAMPRRAQRAAFLAALALLLLSATPALAADAPAAAASGITEEQVLAIAFDVLVLRPMGFLQTMIGGAMLPVACLVALPSWMFDFPGAVEADAIVDYLVRAPAEHLFNRPLGELS